MNILTLKDLDKFDPSNPSFVLGFVGASAPVGPPPTLQESLCRSRGSPVCGRMWARSPWARMRSCGAGLQLPSYQKLMRQTQTKQTFLHSSILLLIWMGTLWRLSQEAKPESLCLFLLLWALAITLVLQFFRFPCFLRNLLLSSTSTTSGGRAGCISTLRGAFPCCQCDQNGTLRSQRQMQA